MSRQKKDAVSVAELNVSVSVKIAVQICEVKLSETNSRYFR